MVNIASNGLNRAGGLVGYNWGIIDNSHATGNVSGRDGVGGLVGTNRKSVSNSYSTGNVIATGDSIGGLIGNHDGLDILNSHATGNVECTVWNCSNVGGLIGRASSSVNSTIYNSFATGNATGGTTSFSGVGGFIGKLEGNSRVDASYATGDVTSAERAGGFVGLIKSNAIINNSYATGNVLHRTGATNDKKGGFIGLAEDNAEIHRSYSTGNVINGYTLGGFIGRGDDNVIIMDSYSTGYVSGTGVLGGFIGDGRNNLTINNSFTTSFVDNSTDENIGGFIGNILGDTSISNSYWDIDTTGQTTSLGGEGKTTLEMKQIATFIDWDFNTVWGINPGKNSGYPYLLWQEFELGPLQASVTTQAVTSIGTTSATGNGNITSLGDPDPTAHGICWATTTDPTTNDTCDDKGAATTTGPFTADITGLTPNTTYYARAFATNTAGTSYGDTQQFTTTLSTYTVTPTAGTGGTASNAGTYAHGSTATITATANPGHVFVNWTEGSTVVSCDAQYSFTVTGNRTLRANFSR
ncbi:hypothetical protein C6366_18295, partial [Desulfonatronum sp. SC1]